MTPVEPRNDDVDVIPLGVKVPVIDPKKETSSGRYIVSVLACEHL